MARTKKKSLSRFGFADEKAVKNKMKKIDQLMDNLRKQLGAKGDGDAKKSTLIGAVERLNDQAYDGQKLQTAYETFNTNLTAIGKKIADIDREMNFIDRLVK